MRGIFTPITSLRRQIFTEIAKIAWEEREPSEVDDIPYKVIKGEVPQYRGSIFHERAIVAAMTKLGLGLNREHNAENSRLSKSIGGAVATHSIIKEPLVNVIPFACDACESSKHFVTNNCKKCIAHPCVVVCPVNAISIGKDRAIIDKDKCIDCGKCADACPYHAITHLERPCEVACGVNAIESDELGRAKINYDKCVSCGMCIVSCPFAAIADKSDIFQLVTAIKQGEKVHAVIAPSFVGQFGSFATPGKIVKAAKNLGFTEIIEAALGADVAAKHEAEVFTKIVPDKQPFLGTSCCPSWTMTVKKFFPDLYEYVSPSNTPMVETAKAIKKRSPNGKIVFIGPCISKKIEAMGEDVRPYVDFVITFEELAAIFVAANIDVAEIEEDEIVADASGNGRNFAAASGVAAAVKSSMKLSNPDVDIPTHNANGLSECKKMLTMAKAGKFNGYLLEGMACEGGCVGGPGTMLPISKAKKEVKSFAKESPFPDSLDNPNIE